MIFLLLGWLVSTVKKTRSGLITNLNWKQNLMEHIYNNALSMEVCIFQYIPMSYPLDFHWKWNYSKHLTNLFYKWICINNPVNKTWMN